MRHGHGRERNENQKRPPRQWTVEETVKQGAIEVEVTSSPGDRGGKLYSLVVQREPGREGRPSKFFRPGDIDDAITALKTAKTWIDCDREEHNQQEDRKFRRA